MGTTDTKKIGKGQTLETHVSSGNRGKEKPFKLNKQAPAEFGGGPRDLSRTFEGGVMAAKGGKK